MAWAIIIAVTLAGGFCISASAQAAERKFGWAGLALGLVLSCLIFGWAINRIGDALLP